jgi:hypothetical protein
MLLVDYSGGDCRPVYAGQHAQGDDHSHRDDLDNPARSIPTAGTDERQGWADHIGGTRTRRALPWSRVAWRRPNQRRCYELTWDGESPSFQRFAGRSAGHRRQRARRPLRRLINDLDLRIMAGGSTTYLPFGLDPSNRPRRPRPRQHPRQRRADTHRVARAGSYTSSSATKAFCTR